MRQIENRMVVDSEWELFENQITHEESEESKEPGYYEISTNYYVPESEAYEYALERCLNGTEEEQKEFKEMLVDWFYSGNWVWEE